MQIRISETNKIKTLKSINKITGEERTHSLIGAADYKIENEYVMDEVAFKMWQKYLKDYDNDEKEIEILATELGINEDVIIDRIEEELVGCIDFDDEHRYTQRVLAEFRASITINEKYKEQGFTAWEGDSDLFCYEYKNGNYIVVGDSRSGSCLKITDLSTPVYFNIYNAEHDYVDCIDKFQSSFALFEQHQKEWWAI